MLAAAASDTFVRYTVFKNRPTLYSAATQQRIHKRLNHSKPKKKKKEKIHVIVLHKLTMPLSTLLLPTSPNNTDGPFSHMKATLTTDIT